jgi:hypothetical protein
MINLSTDESQIAYLAKHHYVEDRKEGIKVLYEKIYQYDWDVEGCYHMVSDLFFKIWKERGSDIRHLENFLNDSLPANNWKVGGEGGAIWSSDKKSFNDSETYFARILAMMSYIALTEIKYINIVAKDQMKHYLTLILL